MHKQTRQLILLATLAHGILSCKTHPPRKTTIQKTQQANSVSIVSYQKVSCFSESYQKETGLTCEPSAILASHHHLIIATDKTDPTAQISPLFKINGGQKQDLNNPSILRSKKFESLTMLPNTGLVVACTGFTRYQESDPKYDPYNTCLYWDPNKESSVRILAETTRKDIKSSLSLRTKIQETLRSIHNNKLPAFFKVEGLAAIPGNRIIFGIREIGESYKNPDFVVAMVETTYSITDNGVLSLGDSMRLLYNVNLDAPIKPVGLSSIEYDPIDDQLLMLTSFELGDRAEDRGAFIWTLPMDALEKGLPPTPVNGPNGKILRLANKAEGLTTTSQNELIIIFDDDRITDANSPSQQGFHPRALHEAWLVKLKWINAKNTKPTQ